MNVFRYLNSLESIKWLNDELGQNKRKKEEEKIYRIKYTAKFETKLRHFRVGHD